MLRIREKLLLAYLFPAIVLVVVFVALAYGAMRRALETELRKRLVSIAEAAAGQLDGSLVAGLRRAFAEEGDVLVRKSRTYEYLRLRLQTLRRSTGVRAVSVFDRGPDEGAARGELRNLVEDTGQTPVGDRSYAREADLPELERVFATPESRASVLFTGKDGVVYMSGYAPVRLGQKALAAVAIDAPADFFTPLGELRNTLLTVGGALLFVLVLLSIWLAARLSRPIRALSEAARAIGRGEVRAPILAQGNDEVALLARTMEEMRLRIEAREGELQMMLAGIAHEVRNPLGGIELYAGLLREDVADEPRKLARVQKIERELGYLKNIVTDFLDYARKAPLELGPLALGPYLADLASLLAGDAQGRGVLVQVEIAAGAERVLGDGEKLRAALLNLARNALQAMPGGGTLTLQARPAEEGRVVITVRDTGEGMPENVQREAFTPFFTTRERGTGLGLAFVKKIAAAHGGEVHLESEPGKGTAVSLTLVAPDDAPARIEQGGRP